MLRCVVVDDEELSRQAIRDLVVAHPKLALAGEASDGKDALDVILDLRPDLVFLDIQMPELDGFQVIESLAGETLPAIVFVTAYDGFAIRAFEVDAIDYLLKPVSATRFAAAVERVLSRVRKADASLDQPIRTLASRVSDDRGFVERFVARRGTRHYFIATSDVQWIEAEGNYVRLLFQGQSHLVRATMKSVEARLDPARFVRVHRSAIVAIDHIASVQSSENGEYTIRLRSGEEVESSRTYADRVRSLLR